jgi:hypothetical protein
MSLHFFPPSSHPPFGCFFSIILYREHTHTHKKKREGPIRIRRKRKKSSKREKNCGKSKIAQYGSDNDSTTAAFAFTHIQKTHSIQHNVEPKRKKKKKKKERKKMIYSKGNRGNLKGTNSLFLSFFQLVSYILFHTKIFNY